MDDKNGLKSIAVIFVVYLILAALLPAADDEIYYWCWSKDLQWSYYDHPPMSAFLIRCSTAVFGDSIFAIRVPACIASAFVLYVIGRLTSFKPLLWGVLLSPLFTIFGVLMTPDSPLLMFWAAYLWWLVEVHRRAAQTVADTPTPGVSLRWWVFGGVILGLGVLSKYTMALAVPTGLLSFLVARRLWRGWLPGYVLHGVVAFVVASPILIYNLQQNFEPLLFQWQHSAQKTSNAARSIVEFVGSQILAFGTMPFFLFPWVVLNARQLCADSRLRVCVCLYAPPIAYFLYKSTQTRLEGNWALVCFVSFWPLASEWLQTVDKNNFWRRTTVWAFVPPALASIAILVHWIYPIPLVPTKVDRIHRQIGIQKATHEVARIIREHGESIPVFSNSYQMTSWLRFQSLNAQQIDQLTRPSHFTRPPRRLTDVDRAYVVTNPALPDEFKKGFGTPELIGSVPVVVRGTQEDTLNIRLYSRIPSSDEHATP
jgi:4-amino-4-deoxy-L-arabinose transferase-like glycosyltransferase